jgi:hypothetical protein
MPIRFTEYLKVGEKDVCLYVIQNTDSVDCKVYLFGEEAFQIVMFTKEHGRCDMASQNLPNWVINLAPHITVKIAHRL